MRGHARTGEGDVKTEERKVQWTIHLKLEKARSRFSPRAPGRGDSAAYTLVWDFSPAQL